MTIGVSITTIIIAGCWLAKVASSRERHYLLLAKMTEPMKMNTAWRLATENGSSDLDGWLAATSLVQSKAR